MKAKKQPNPLQPLILACQKHRGLKSSVLAEMVKRGSQANWGNLSGWLNPDPACRRSPRSQTLKLLLAIQKEWVK